MKARFTIIIINSIPPYAFELNNILALPKGFSYRFRFQNKKKDKWMPEISNPKDILETNGLIVLRDFQKTANFIPIRHIFIHDVKLIGEIVYIEFDLQNRINYSSDLKERDSQMEKFNNRIIVDINTAKYKNIPNQDLNNLIFFGNDYTHDFKNSVELDDSDEIENNRWGNSIEVIGKANEGDNIFQDVDFINLIGIFNSNDTKASIILKKTKNYIRLNNKEEYTVRFFQRTYTGISNKGDSSIQNPRKAILKSGSDDIKIIQDEKDILGKYDLYEYPISIQKQKTESVKTFLYFNIKTNNTNKFPSIKIPVYITPSIKSLFTSILIIIAFLLCLIVYWYSDNIVQYIFKDADNLEKLSENLKNILLPILILLGSNTYLRLTSIKEFVIGRIYL